MILEYKYQSIRKVLSANKGSSFPVISILNYECLFIFFYFSFSPPFLGIFVSNWLQEKQDVKVLVANPLPPTF